MAHLFGPKTQFGNFWGEVGGCGGICISVIRTGPIFWTFYDFKEKDIYMYEFFQKNHLPKVKNFFLGNLLFSILNILRKKMSLLRGRGCISLSRTGLKYITCESFESRKQTFKIFSLFSDKYFINCLPIQKASIKLVHVYF